MSGCLGGTSVPAYLWGMDKDYHLHRHLALCRRMYLRMLADGTWPWKEERESPDLQDVVESKDIENDV